MTILTTQDWPEEALLVATPPEQVDELAMAEELQVSMEGRQEAPVANPTDMAAALSAATEGRVSYKDAVANLITSYGPTTIREVAAATVAQDMQYMRNEFSIAAAQQDLATAEQMAQRIFASDAALKQGMSDWAANKQVSKAAAANMVSANVSTVENTSPEYLAKVAEEKGQLFAISQIVQNEALKQSGGYTPSLVDVGGYIGGYIAAGVLGGKVGAAIGTAVIPAPGVGTVVGGVSGAILADVAYAFEAFKVVPDAIEKVTGIKNPDTIGYVAQVDALRKHLLTFPMDQQKQLLEEITANIFDSTFLPGDLGKLQGVIASAKLYDSITEGHWNSFKDFSVPLVWQERLDQLGVFLGAYGGLKALQKYTSAAKTGSDLAGGAAIGSTIGKNITEGESTLGLAKTDETALSLSFDMTQFMPQGIVGTSGEVQKVLQENVQQMWTKINERLAVSTDPEVVKMREWLDRNVQPSTFHYASTDLSTGQVLLQHFSGKPFTSYEAAKSLADSLSKESGIAFEVVAANNASVSKFGSRIDVKYQHSDVLADVYEELDMMGDTVRAADVVDALAKDASITDLKTGVTSEDQVLKNTASMLSKGKLLDGVNVAFVDSAEGWRNLAKKMLGKNASVAAVEDKVVELSGLAGKFDPYTNTVYLRSDVKTSPGLLLHEVAHAKFGSIIEVATSGNKAAIKAAGLSAEQLAAVENLKTLYAHVDDHMRTHVGDGYQYTKGMGDYYGFANIHEMVSEALTNGQFQQLLKNIPVTKEVLAEMRLTDLSFVGQIKTAWDAFVNRINKALGWKTGDDSLSHTLNQIATLNKAVDKSQQDMVAKLKSQGLSDKQIKSIILDDGLHAVHGYYIRHTSPTTTATHSRADIDSRWGLGLDPLHRASREAVEERWVGLLQEQKDRRAMADFVKKAFDPLSKEQLKRVHSVLDEGDAFSSGGGAGREFTVTELMARGVHSNEEHLAYFTARTMSNVNHFLKNQEAIRSMGAQGYRQGSVTIGGVAHSAPMRTTTFADGTRAWDVSVGAIRSVNNTQMAAAGKVAVESLRPLDIGGQQITRIVADANAMSWGPLQPVIPYLPGTFRRIYMDDTFIRANVNVLRNGDVTDDFFHVRTARSEKDAAKWVSGMNEVLRQWRTNPTALTLANVERLVGKWEDATQVMAHLSRGDWDDVTSFSKHINREAADYTNTFVKSGLDDLSAYTKARGLKLTPIDNPVRRNTMEPLSALQAEITNVARSRNIGEWREKYVDMWWNSFKHLVPPNIRNSGTPVQIMQNMRAEMYSGSSKEAKFAESQRVYLLQQLGVKTLDESFIEAQVRRLTAGLSEDSRLFGFNIGTPLVVAGAAMRSADPLQFFRSLNFTLMLGMFNPAQLVVQANGAMTAIAVSPLHGLKASYSAPILRMALMSDNPAVWDKMASWDSFSKAGFGNRAEFIDTVKAIKRSGLLDGINSTSLHNLQEGRFNLYSPFTRKLQETNTFFFDRGEEFTRLVAFDVARREMLSSNPGVSLSNPDVLKNILIRADDLTQNMSKANAARYQQGILSLPFQFLQYNIKLGANTFGAVVKGSGGRGFTRAEALRIMGAHVLAYGMVGNGLSFLYDEVVGSYEAAVGRKVTSDEKLAFSQGAIAAIVNELSQATTGEDLQLATGSRLGAFEFYDKFAKSLLSLDGVKLVDALGGPTTGTMKRMGVFGDVASTLLRDPNITTQDVMRALTTIGSENISTWRNATKAYYASVNGNIVQSNTGEPIAAVSTPEMIAQGLGITAASVDDFYRVRKNIKEHTAAIKELAKEYDRVRLVYMRELVKTGPSKDTADLAKAMSTLIPVNVGDRDLFFKALTDGTAWPYRDELTKTTAKYLSQGMYNLKDSIVVKDVGVQMSAPLMKE